MKSKIAKNGRKPHSLGPFLEKSRIILAGEKIRFGPKKPKIQKKKKFS